MCGAIVARWILEHRADGLSAYLDEQSPDYIGRLAQMAQDNLNIRSTTVRFSDWGSPNHEWGAEVVLRFLLSKGMSSKPRRIRRRKKFEHRDFADQIANDVAQIYETDLYQHIALLGQPKSHSVAAHISRGRYEFFDPNYGQFVFADRQKFVPWLSRYLQHIGYVAPRAIDYGYIIDYVGYRA